jgi:hypothetical protein
MPAVEPNLPTPSDTMRLVAEVGAPGRMGKKARNRGEPSHPAREVEFELMVTAVMWT